MRREDFGRRYKLRKRLSEGSIRSYDAVDSAGAPLMVHVLAGPPDDVQKCLALLTRLDPSDKSKVVETVQVEGVQVVVTKVLEDFHTLPGWLDSHARGAGPESERSEPGEFTKLFQAIPGEEEKKPSQAGEVARRSGAAESVPTPASTGESGGKEGGKTGGTFTGLFGQPAKEAPPHEPPEEEKGTRRRKPLIRWRKSAPEDAEEERKPLVRWGKGKARREPGQEPSGAAPSEEGTQVSGSGEFTELFEPKSEAPAAPALRPDLATPIERSTQDYLEALEASRPGPQDVSHLKPTHDTPPARAVPPVGPPPPATTPARQGPSDFTRVVEGRASASPYGPPDSPGLGVEQRAAPVNDRGGPGLRPLLIGLGVLFLAALIVVVLFALL